MARLRRDARMRRSTSSADDRYDVVIVGGAVHGASLPIISQRPASTAACSSSRRTRPSARGDGAFVRRRSASSSRPPVNIAISLYGIDFLRAGRRACSRSTASGPRSALREGGYLFLATRGRRGDARAQPRAADGARRRHPPSRPGRACRALSLARDRRHRRRLLRPDRRRLVRRLRADAGAAAQGARRSASSS